MVRIGLFPWCTYSRGRGQAGTLDLLVPLIPGGPPPPVVIVVHGGGWTAGDKGDESLLPFIHACHYAGLATCSVNYRMAPAVRWPVPAEDIEEAIAWLMVRAPAPGIGPSRGWGVDLSRGVGVLGVSAGAHLAASVALRGLMRFRAVVGVAGAYDLTTLQAQTGLTFDWTLTDAGAVNQLLGHRPAENMARANDASPAQHARTLPPFFLAHGDADAVVPIEQARDMATMLLSVGGSVELDIIAGGIHGGEVLSAAVAARAATFLQVNLAGG